LAGNYGALSRYGISVKDLKTDEEKRASLLQQLNVLYERAKGEVDTFTGATQQLKNAWGDAKEQIGDAVIKNQDLLKIIKDLTAKITELIETGKIAEWAKDAASGIITTVNALKLFFTLTSGKPVIASMSENFADWTMNIIGLKSPQQEINELQAEAIQKAIKFRDSLKYLKPSMEEIRKVSKRSMSFRLKLSRKRLNSGIL